MSVNTTIFRSGGNSENLRTQFNALRADVTAIRAAVLAITAKLDAENVTNLDTDYAATCDPAALTSADLTQS